MCKVISCSNTRGLRPKTSPFPRASPVYSQIYKYQTPSCDFCCLRAFAEIVTTREQAVSILDADWLLYLKQPLSPTLLSRKQTILLLRINHHQQSASSPSGHFINNRPYRLCVKLNPGRITQKHHHAYPITTSAGLSGPLCFGRR